MDPAPSLTDRFFKLLDHNRFTVLATLISACAMGLASCAYKTVSPVSGKNVTDAQLVAEADEFAEKQKLESERAARESQRAILNLQAEYQAKIQEATDEFELSEKERIAAGNAMSAKVEAAFADIERQRTVVNDIFSFVSSLPVVSGNPLAAGALALLPTLITGGVVVDNRRKDGVIKKLKREPPATE